MCGSKGYGFLAVLVIGYQFKLLSAILVINRVWFLHSNLDMGIKYIPHKWIVLFARADWLARWLAKYYSLPSSRRKTKWLLSLYFHKKVTIWAASYSACVVYSCFEKGCLTIGARLTRQCRKLLWVMVILRLLDWTSRCFSVVEGNSTNLCIRSFSFLVAESP